MAWVVADRIKETSTTTGTGDFTLGGAVGQYRAFSSVAVNNDQVAYVIVYTNGTEWECGIGTWTTGEVLKRDRVQASSNAGALVNFSAGPKEVFLDVVATLAMLHPVDRIQTEDRYIPPDTSVYAAQDYTIAAGKTLSIGLNGILEVG